MKRLFFSALILCVLGIGAVQAQNLNKGSGLLSLGTGFFNGFSVNASYDFGLIDEWGPGIFTVGGFVGYVEHNLNHTYKGKNFALTPRATYRYAVDEFWEVYGTFMWGLLVGDYNSIFMASTIGARFNITKNFSLFAEMGPTYNNNYTLFMLGINLTL